jgi:asparagine synthase (glutamine-hydrolysing)
MTGICGSWHRDGAPLAGEECARMQSALAIYGRDRSDRWDGGNIALGIQLARLVPEDRFDRQPFVSEDGRFVLVADIRIDNRLELAEALDIPADRLALMADAELLLAAWVRWGREAIPRIYGDFAFVVWDAQSQRLFLARDYPGSRPLFYHVGNGWIAFASMVKGLHALPGVSVAPDMDVLANHLLLLPPSGSRSFFSGVRRVEPGGLTVIAADGVIDSSIWYHPPAPLPEGGDPSDLVDRVREVFTQAVDARLRSVRPVAANLSGGLDSGAAVAVAARLLAASQRRLTAFTHVPLPDVPIDEPQGRFADEGPRARILAAGHANIDHVLVDSRDRQIIDDLAESAYFAEFPNLNLCNNLWITEIARQASVTGHGVMLVGTWGNMTLSYHGHQNLGELLARGRILAWLREAYASYRRESMSLKSLFFNSIRPMLPPSVEFFLRRFSKNPAIRIENVSSIQVGGSGVGRYSARGQDSSSAPLVLPRGRVASVMHIFKFQEILTLLRKGLLGRYGIDYRDPYGDRRLLDLCFALPDSLFLRDGEPKWLYQQVFAEIVPDAIRRGPGKGLQGADWWPRLRMRRHRVMEELERARSSPTAAELVDLDTLIAVTADMPETDRVTQAMMETYRLKLLRGLSVAYFLRRLDGGNG